MHKKNKEEQRQLYMDNMDRLDHLNTEKQARLKNTITKWKRSSDASCKDKKDH